MHIYLHIKYPYEYTHICINKGGTKDLKLIKKEHVKVNYRYPLLPLKSRGAHPLSRCVVQQYRDATDYLFWIRTFLLWLLLVLVLT